jgi:signal transduction histidine kinase
MAKIIFSDTGCGIAEQDLEKIFEPFYSTKQDGTGLGLSIVHNIVHNAGGKIHVESEIKKGTRFIIILPCVREVKGDGPD